MTKNKGIFFTLASGFLLKTVILCGISSLALAQENTSSQSKMKATDLGVKTQELKDIDEEITNARLRASTGSKSKFSIQTEFGYSGGSVGSPIGKTRPKLDAGPIVPDYTAAYGSISGKYRINERNNINLGSGIGLTTPGFEGQRSELQDPYLSFSHLIAINGYQNVLLAQITAHSSKSNLDAKNEYGIDFTHTILTNIGKSKWQAGLSTALSYEGYSGFVSKNAQAAQSVIG
ncbi:MAG: hypothetical protein L6Q37_16520, partial [Bdellovibrionaceae bacterium]|nr:hypothetical protein [Pseudobdellovibrionaceae bacterium]